MRFFALLLVAFAVLLRAEAPTIPQLEATFLFKFTEFVQWPEDAFAAPDAPFIIAVVGRSPFGNFLDEIVTNESVGKHRIQTRYYVNANAARDALTECHILYVCDSEIDRVDTLLNRVKGRPVLTVAHFESFAKRGGIIRFKVEEDKIRFRVNIDSAKEARLTISSKILRAAEIVENSK